MKYALVFVGLSAVLFFYAAALGGAWWLLAWLGLNFLIVGLAYGGLGPGIFGKQPSGKLAAWAVVLLLPYFGLTWGLWHLQRAIRREACCNEVAPGVWIGRRAFAHELPANVRTVVDLTAEFAEPAAVCTGRQYLCFPLLDAHAPQQAELRSIVAALLDAPSPIYVHCALGHGRSGMITSALLRARGIVENVSEAEQLILEKRPEARMNARQRKALRLLCDTV